MSESLNSQLQELRTLTPQLNKTADEAAAVVSAVEKFLSDCGCAIREEVYCHGTELAKDRTRDTFLRYCRLGGEMRIAIEDRIYELSDDSTPDWQNWIVAEIEGCKPWANASREEKLSTFPELPKLINAILDAARKQISAVAKASDSTKEMLAALK